MSLPDLIARPLLAGIFIYGGIESLRKPAPESETTSKVTARLSELTGIGDEQLVRANGAVQVLAGIALATGVLPRPAAAVLAASLVPTTLGAHSFWEMRDERRSTHRTQFLKNAAMFGGLISVANSTGGRPSLPWRAKRAIEGAVDTSVGAIGGLLPG